MKVFIKILDGKNTFYYPAITTYAWQLNQYRLKIRYISNVMRLAQIFDTEIERDINKIHRIKRIAENDNCTIEIMPVNNFLGTYLSTGEKIKAYKAISIFIGYLITLPMIILLIITYLLA